MGPKNYSRHATKLKLCSTRNPNHSKLKSLQWIIDSLTFERVEQDNIECSWSCNSWWATVDTLSTLTPAVATRAQASSPSRHAATSMNRTFYANCYSNSLRAQPHFDRSFWCSIPTSGSQPRLGFRPKTCVFFFSKGNIMTGKIRKLWV